MTDQTPRTEAGRRLLAIWENNESHRDAILAIEAEARADALREAAERVRALRVGWMEEMGGNILSRAAVLAILTETER